MTREQNLRLNRLMAAPYPLTRRERRQLKALLRESSGEANAEAVHHRTCEEAEAPPPYTKGFQAWLDTVAQ
jgi:hypothetical protein